ncbi:3849_t:CDS:2 [Funneliformis caledonium]|uniref:3849_t:CDS:1 n=1 Tax=Funneliformis caledonium TaxID=1117310 RepID=A0A9N9DQV0_9GLOM|nr:3849_t:CDS:2 [Funneliformis caledonium]
MLQDFVENDIDDWLDLEDMQQDDHLDKENIDPSICQLQNLKVRHGKGVRYWAISKELQGGLGGFI